MNLTRILALSIVSLSAVHAEEEKSQRAEVLAKLKQAGVGITSSKDEKRAPNSPLPNCYSDHFSVVLSPVAPKGGQFFICNRKEYGDSLVAYFRQLQGIAGPYVYQSKDGRVVAQLSSSIPFAEAEKIEAALKPIELK